MIKKLLVFFLTIFTMTAYAQNVTMTGTVVDTDNLPLIGVNVVIKGTSTGTTTDLDGKFTLTGENGQTLVFSYIGMTIIRKSKFPQNPKRSVRFSGKRTKRSVQKRKARNTQKAETKVL